MQVDKWIASATRTLADAGIKTARLDTLVLTETVISKDRSWLLAHPTDEIEESDIYQLNKLIIRRASHYPLAYITNHAYFYNNMFYVDEHVLIPRPESEAIIDALKTLSPNNKLVIIDVGTGSGALAITAKLLFPASHVIALDINPECLKIAKKNSISLHADVEFLQSDLLESLPTILEANSVVIANLPYVPTDFPINQSADFEPRVAIFSGKDGLDLYVRLFKEVSSLALKPGYIITESLSTQHRPLQSIARGAGYELQDTNDYVQLFSHRH